MNSYPQRSLMRSLFRWVKRMWPQVPVGLLLIFVGAVNVLIGLENRPFSPLLQILGRVAPLSELSQEVSLGVLGSGVQVLLGSAMLLTGVGLFWRLRSAWAYSILLVLITIGVNLVSSRPIRDVFLPGLALVALAVWHHRFSRRSMIGSYLMSLIGLLAVLAYGIFGSLLLGSSFQPIIHDIYTAVYFTVVTLSTVGSYIYPATPQAQVFMVTLILGGISIFTTTIVVTLGPLVSEQIRPLFSRTRDRLEAGNNLILVGATWLANDLALELTRRGVAFVQVISAKDEPATGIHQVVYGEPGAPALKEAGILFADTVIVAGDDDAANASISRTAKELNPKVRVIAVASRSKAIEQLKLARADLVFAPMAIAARVLSHLIRGDSLPGELEDLFEGS